VEIDPLGHPESCSICSGSEPGLCFGAYLFRHFLLSDGSETRLAIRPCGRCLYHRECCRGVVEHGEWPCPNCERVTKVLVPYFTDSIPPDAESVFRTGTDAFLEAVGANAFSVVARMLLDQALLMETLLRREQKIYGVQRLMRSLFLLLRFAARGEGFVQPPEPEDPAGRLLWSLVASGNPEETLRELVPALVIGLSAQERLEFARRAQILAQWAVRGGPEIDLDLREETISATFGGLDLTGYRRLDPFTLFVPSIRMIDFADVPAVGDAIADQGDTQIICLRSGQPFRWEGTSVLRWTDAIPEAFTCTFVLFLTGPRAGTTWFWNRDPEIRRQLGESESWWAQSLYHDQFGNNDYGYDRGELLVLNEKVLEHLANDLVSARWLDLIKAVRIT
jgi:hypothetical protein